MVHLKDGIDTLTRFKRESSAFIDRLKACGEPIVLTVNGRAEVVVQDAAAYQAMAERAAKAAYAEEVAAIQEGINDLDAGRVRPAADVFRDHDAKLKAMLKAYKASA